MYGFELQKGVKAVNHSANVGSVEGSLLWLIFKGDSLGADSDDYTASIMESGSCTNDTLEIDVARVAHLMHPRLVAIGPRGDRKPLPAIPSENGKNEAQITLVLTVEKGILARLEKRSKANRPFFNRELQ